MKIRIGPNSGPHADIDVSAEPVLLRDVFCGIGIETDQGCFGIAQRDGGIEVLLDGKLVWSSSWMREERGDVIVNDEDPVLEKPNELLAEYAHDVWSGWMKYLFQQCLEIEDDYGRRYGDMKIPARCAERWRRQMYTPYKDLPEVDKGSDRAEALKMQFIIHNNALPK